MRIERGFACKVTKKDSAGGLFGNVMDALRACECPRPRVIFELQDSMHLRTSPTQRVVRKYPEMAASHQSRTDSDDDEGRTYSVLANWTGDPGAPQVSTDQPSLEVLAEIAKGIPRPFSFNTARFVFTEVPCLELVEGGDEHVVPRHTRTPQVPIGRGMAGVFVCSDWTPTRRMNLLWASVHQPAPPHDASEVPELPAPTQEFLDALGCASIPSTSPVFNRAEAEEREALQEKGGSVTSTYNDGMPEMLRRIPLPHDLPETEVMGADGFEKFGSPKKPLVAAFRHRGFRYQSTESGQGVYTFTKRTALSNEIELSFDTGRMTKSVTAGLHLRGFALYANVRLPVSARAAHMTQYPMMSMQQWGRIVDNIAVVVDHLEKTFVPEIETAWGACPLWYADGR